MATLHAEKDSHKAKPQNTEPSWEDVFRYSALGLMVIIITVLHLVQPDLDFSEGTTMFLWPLSPTRIASPFSMVYTTYLLSLVLVDRRGQILISTNELTQNLESYNDAQIYSMLLTRFSAALTLSADVLKLCFMVAQFVYEDLPAYQAGNMSVEGAWAGATFLWAMFGTIALFVIFLLWIPTIKLLRCKQERAKIAKSVIRFPCCIPEAGRINSTTPATVQDQSNNPSHNNKDISPPTSTNHRQGSPSNSDEIKQALYEWTVVPTEQMDDRRTAIIEEFGCRIAGYRYSYKNSSHGQDWKHWKTLYENLDAVAQGLVDDCREQLALREAVSKATVKGGQQES